MPPARIPPPGRAQTWVWAWGSLAVVALCFARGAWILGHPAPPSGTARVAVVQASESREMPGSAVVCVSSPEAYLGWTRTALRGGADLVVWPETACQADCVNDRRAREFVASMVRGTRASLLAGSFVEHLPSGRWTNAAALFSPTGEVRGQYAKVLIVPFGEYLPMRPLLRWTERLGMPADDLRAGDRWAPLRWDRGSIGVSICFESAFGSISRTLVLQGADLLAVMTSDGWAGRTAVGRQHAGFAPLRAVECRRSVARAAATGISQLIDPYGRPLQSLAMFRQGTLLSDLPLRRDLTLYARLGDWPVWLAWLVLLLASSPLARRARTRQPRDRK